MTLSLSCRNNSDNVFRAFHIHDDNNGLSQESDCDPTVLTIVVPRVEVDDQRAVEYLGNIHKINAVFTDIGEIFVSVPFKNHALIVVAICSYVNGRIVGKTGLALANGAVLAHPAWSGDYCISTGMSGRSIKQHCTLVSLTNMDLQHGGYRTGPPYSIRVGSRGAEDRGRNSEDGDL